MEFPEVSDSHLTWSWVIEALAASREVELDLLCDLIDNAPNLSDNLSEAAREMIALRNLESLYDPAKVLNNGASSDEEGIQFDASECFSSVLQRIMDQPSVSSLRKDGSNPLPIARKVSDKLIREVHVLIEKRKASMPICALEELSNILHKGNVCRQTNLKREKKWLQIGNAPSVELPPQKKLRHDNNGLIASTKQNSASLTSSQVRECPIDFQSGNLLFSKKLRHDCNGSAASTQKNSANPSISSDMQVIPVDGQSSMSPPGRNFTPESNGSVASKEKNSVPLSSDGNQPYPLSSMPAQPVGLLTWDPRTLSSKDEKVNAKISSTLADTIELDLDVCIKCNEGGEVLTCSVSSCPTVVHKRCLGYSISIDNKDDFLCPFCACSYAKSEYAEAKEKMLLAREKLSLFIGGNPDNQSMGFTNANAPRQGVNVRMFKGKGVHCVDQASTDKQNEGHGAQNNVHTFPHKSSAKDREVDIGIGSSQLERRFVNVNANPPRQGRDERSFKGNSVYQADKSSTDKKSEGHISRDNVHTSTSNCSKKGEDITAKKCQLGEELTDVNANSVHQQMKGGLVCDTLHTSPSHISSEEGDVTDKNCQLEKGKSVVSIEHFNFAGANGGFHEPRSRNQLAILSKNASCASYGDGVSLKKTFGYTASKSSQIIIRPTRVPWTEEEVEMLKEAMKKFGCKDMKVIPWTSILDYGRKVFWEGRTAVNLKDKWRNLMKANPDLI